MGRAHGHLLWCWIINIIDFLKSDLGMQSSKSSQPYPKLIPPNTVVLYFKKITLGHMSMKKVQRQATGWQKIFRRLFFFFTIEVSDKGLAASENVQIEMHFTKDDNQIAEKCQERCSAPLFFGENKWKSQCDTNTHPPKWLKYKTGDHKGGRVSWAMGCSHTADGSANMVLETSCVYKANHVPTRLGFRVAGLGTELDKNKRRTRDLG